MNKLSTIDLKLSSNNHIEEFCLLSLIENCLIPPKIDLTKEIYDLLDLVPTLMDHIRQFLNKSELILLLSYLDPFKHPPKALLIESCKVALAYTEHPCPPWLLVEQS